MDENTSQVKAGHQHHKLPNVTTVLVLGILSIGCIIVCIFNFASSFGVFAGSGLASIFFCFFGLLLARKNRKMYKDAPEFYSSKSLRASNFGRVCSLIGVVIGSFLLVCVLIF